MAMDVAADGGQLSVIAGKKIGRESGHEGPRVWGRH
jgi:hypothetical protein